MSTPATTHTTHTTPDANGAQATTHSDTPTLTRVRKATISANTPKQRRHGQRMTAEEKQTAQKAFLDTFSRTGNVSTACKMAGIHRDTLYWWKEHDLKFSMLVNQAEAEAADTLRGEAWRRAILGEEVPLVSAGRLVYEEEPVLNPDGSIMLDPRGKPVYKHGKVVTVKQRSDRLLEVLLKARCDEFRPPQKVEVSGQDGGPIQTEHRAVFVLPVPAETDEE